MERPNQETRQGGNSPRRSNRFLLPMHVQYLVGLCCQKANPNAVDITLGDMVFDDGEDKHRDVDVTVTVAESATVVRAFKAYEVKDERRPLDVITVEQLCMKLLDMSSITHRAIVSGSGFTEGARKKAAHHGVELYLLKEEPLTQSTPHLEVSPGSEMRFVGRRLLCWRENSYSLSAPNGPRLFQGTVTSDFYRHDGSAHPVFSSPRRFRDEILLRSTEALCQTRLELQQASPDAADPEVGWVEPSWPESYTLDLRSDDVYIRFDGQLVQVESVTIDGRLQWKIDRDRNASYSLERDPTGERYASALIALGPRDQQMFAIVASPGSMEVKVHIVTLEEKHLRAIRQLRLQTT